MCPRSKLHYIPDEHHYGCKCHPCRIYTLHLTSLGPISSFCRQTWVSLNTYKSTIDDETETSKNAPGRTKRPIIVPTFCRYFHPPELRGIRMGKPCFPGPRSPSKEAEPEVGEAKDHPNGWDGWFLRLILIYMYVGWSKKENMDVDSLRVVIFFHFEAFLMSMVYLVEDGCSSLNGASMKRMDCLVTWGNSCLGSINSQCFP